MDPEEHASWSWIWGGILVLAGAGAYFGALQWRRGVHPAEESEGPLALLGALSAAIAQSVAAAALVLGWWWITEPLPRAWQPVCFLGLLGALSYVDWRARRPAPSLWRHIGLGVALAFLPLAWVLSPLVRTLERTLQRHMSPRQPAQMPQPETASARDPEQAELITGLLEFRGKTARDVLVSRLDMAAVPATASWETVRQLIEETGYSRIPVYGESPDEILGVLYAKDLLELLQQSPPDPPSWIQMVRPALFVPPSTGLEELLRLFQQRRQHMAIVVDEFGGTLGLVTLRDVIDEIIGEPQEEQTVPSPQALGPGEYRLDGRTRLEDLEQLLGRRLGPEEPALETVAGLILYHAGRVPAAGDTLLIDRFRFVIEEATSHRILRLRVQRLDQVEPTPPNPRTQSA